MRAQPVIAEGEIRVAAHVELHEGGILVEAPANELSGDGREEPSACRTEGGWSAGGGRRHEGPGVFSAASTRLRKQCETQEPTGSRHLTRRYLCDTSAEDSASWIPSHAAPFDQYLNYLIIVIIFVL